MSEDDSSRGRNERGRYTPEITDDDVLEVLETSSDPVLTSKEVAEALSVSRQTVHRRLAKLHERGDVAKKEVGPSVVWYLAE